MIEALSIAAGHARCHSERQQRIYVLLVKDRIKMCVIKKRKAGALTLAGWMRTPALRNTVTRGVLAGED
ncbi:protein of unknown function [Nitrospina watsonii]|uniref:Uncharacterized protein n=1 Tax=Nitrospina watsonii TaxID=1323948 RepID=A0ABM9HBI2_9BACT|nr:protein of unknown function [Nitrospina watsonii]